MTPGGPSGQGDFAHFHPPRRVLHRVYPSSHVFYPSGLVFLYSGFFATMNKTAHKRINAKDIATYSKPTKHA